MNEGVKKLKSDNNFKVSGISVQYFTICKRELWFYQRGVDIDKQNVHIVRGTDIDNNSYNNIKSDAERQIINNEIAPDILQDGRIIEVKPSKKLEKASENQLYYYLWYFKNILDDKRSGVMAYPNQRQRNNIQLSKENEKQIEEIIDGIYDIYCKDEPPEFKEKPYCDSCAYKDFCQI